MHARCWIPRSVKPLYEQQTPFPSFSATDSLIPQRLNSLALQARTARFWPRFHTEQQLLSLLSFPLPLGPKIVPEWDSALASRETIAAPDPSSLLALGLHEAVCVLRGKSSGTWTHGPEPLLPFPRALQDHPMLPSSGGCGLGRRFPTCPGNGLLDAWQKPQARCFPQSVLPLRLVWS